MWAKTCYILCSKMDKRNPDYEYVYICKACKEKFNRQYVFGFDPQGIIEAINVKLVSKVHSNRLKEMCIDISMSIVNRRLEKVFHYEETWVPVIKYKDEIWFKDVAVATILRYKNTMKSICDHVDPEDKRELSELGLKTKQNETDPLKSKQNESFWLKTGPLKRNEGNTIYINESGLYSLILRSKLESARAFKRWVTKDVLPSIRKTGMYSSTLVNIRNANGDLNHKYTEALTFKIENEFDIHVKTVSFLKKRFPRSLFTATLGENQCTSAIRIDSLIKKATSVALQI